MASGIKNSHMSAPAFKITIPGFSAMIRKIRHTLRSRIVHRICPFSSESRMCLSKLYCIFCKILQVLSTSCFRPLDPGKFIVLAVDIIISLLGILHLIPTIDSRNSLREQYQQKCVPKLPFPELLQLPRRSLTFFPVIAAAVIITAIPIVLTVGFIMFALIRH